MGSGPLTRKKTPGQEGKEDSKKRSKAPETSGKRGSDTVANDPDCGAVAGRVVTGLPLRTCVNPVPSPSILKVETERGKAMASTDDAIGDVVHVVVVMGASVSCVLSRMVY